MGFGKEERGEEECLIHDGVWSCGAQRLSRGWRSSLGDGRSLIPEMDRVSFLIRQRSAHIKPNEIG